MVGFEQNKLIVLAALVAPGVAAFFEWSLTPLVLAIIGGGAYIYFDANFVHKSDIPRREPPPMGPQEPYRSVEPEWVRDPMTGQPMPQYYPPGPRRR